LSENFVLNPTHKVKNTDVEAPNPSCKPKLDTTVNLSLNSDWLIGMLFQDQQR